MTWYTTGTVAVTNANATVTGTSTAWIANAAAGMGWRGPDRVIYEIQSVNSDVSITLATPYQGSTASGQTYSLMPTQDYIRSLASQVASLILTYSTIATAAGAGKFGDGTVASPGITFGSNTNTGFYRVGANTIGIAVNGAQSAVFDSGGGLGIGNSTPTTWGRLVVGSTAATGAISEALAMQTNKALLSITPDGATNANGTTIIYSWANGGQGPLKFANAAGTVMTLDASGYLGIGTASPSAKLHVVDSASAVAGPTIRTQGGGGGYGAGLEAGSALGTSGAYKSMGKIVWDGNAAWSSTDVNTQNSRCSIWTTLAGATAEKVRVEENGVVLVNRTTLQTGVSNTCTLMVASSGAEYTAALENSHATIPYGVYIKYSGAAPNGTSSQFFAGYDSGALRAEIRSNGGLSNFSANNVNLSDERTKKDFAPAPSFYARWRDINFVTFLYKDQTDDARNLGVGASQLESVCPELVDCGGFGETPADGIPLKAVYQTDFQYAAAVALQEAIEKIEAQSARIEALLARVAALEAAGTVAH